MTFDARAAKLLAPGAHLNMDECPGLRLVASTAGHSWIYRYRNPEDGRLRQVKIGAWPAISVSVATATWERLRIERAQGRDPAAEKQAARAKAREDALVERKAKREAGYLVKDLCEDYVVGHVERLWKPKGVKEMRRMFATMLGDFGDLSAAAVTRSQAFDFLEGYLDIPVQCLKLRSQMGAAWDYGLDAGRLPEATPNWWRQLMRGKVRSKGRVMGGVNIGKKKRVLTEDELKVLIPWLPNFSRLVEDVCTLYLWTATRGVEIVAMMGSEIAEEADGLWWIIPKAKTKNERFDEATDLRVPLVGRAAGIVRRRMLVAGAGYLFPAKTDSGHTEQKLISESVYCRQPYCTFHQDRAWAKLTVTNWAPHDLRRTSRTVLASLGCPPEVAEAILGHMPEGIVGVYNLHSYDKERRLWLTKLDRHYESLLAP